MERGVYVWETFPGITEVRAVGRSGRTVRKVIVPTSLFMQSEVDEMWRFLGQAEEPVPRLFLMRQ
jgi:hypothetical protein